MTRLTAWQLFGTLRVRPDLHKAKMHQIRFSLGLCPIARWGSLQRSPDPLYLDLRGPTSKGRGRLFAVNLTRGGGNTDVCPRWQKPSRCHCVRDNFTFVNVCNSFAEAQHIYASSVRIQHSKLMCYTGTQNNAIIPR